MGAGHPRGTHARASDAHALHPQLIQDVARLQRRSLRHSRQLEVPRPYIAARFSVLPSVFHPGDQKQYGGFDNRGLEPGHRYVLFVLAVLQKSEPVSASSPAPGPRSPRPSSWRKGPWHWGFEEWVGARQEEAAQVCTCQRDQRARWLARGGDEGRESSHCRPQPPDWAPGARGGLEQGWGLCF